MENELTPELLEKAKQAKSPEELVALAKENGIALSDEQANAYFAKLNPKSGELADDELDQVSGGRNCGTTYYEDHPVVSHFNSCERYCYYGYPKGNGERNDGSGQCRDCVFFASREFVFICVHPARLNN